MDKKLKLTELNQDNFRNLIIKIGQPRCEEQTLLY